MLRLMFVCSLVLASSVMAQTASKIDFQTLKNSVLLSSISYANSQDVDAKLNNLGHTLVRHVVLPATQMRYFLSDENTSKNTIKPQWLSFRGTSNLENVLVDLDVSLVHDARLNIMLHRGFATTAYAAYQDIKPQLDKQRPVNTTGHSLGGAMAVIVAMYLQRDGFDVQQVITFGQPKVTNVAGARAFSNLPLLRVVTPKDIVPLVPPLSPMQLQNLDIYWHLGQEVILLPGQQYSLIAGLKSMMRATQFFSAVPDETNVRAHDLAMYLALIDSKLESSQQVRHAMKLSFF